MTKKRISIRIDENLLERIERELKDEIDTRTGRIEKLLRDAFKK